MSYQTFVTSRTMIEDAVDDFQDAGGELTTTMQFTWWRLGHGPSKDFHCFIAEGKGKPASWQLSVCGRWRFRADAEKAKSCFSPHLCCPTCRTAMKFDAGVSVDDPLSGHQERPHGSSDRKGHDVTDTITETDDGNVAEFHIDQLGHTKIGGGKRRNLLNGSPELDPAGYISNEIALLINENRESFRAGYVDYDMEIPPLTLLLNEENLAWHCGRACATVMDAARTEQKKNKRGNIALPGKKS